MTWIVVGGGITGISCALELSERLGNDDEILLVEAESTLGGKIRSIEFEGHLIEVGPDAFLTRENDGLDLCHTLGLDNEIVRPIKFSANIYTKGHMYPVPDGMMLGVPINFATFLKTSTMLSPWGRLRAAFDLIIPKTRLATDSSIGALVVSRFGKQVNDVLVDSMLGGINAGSTSDLSIVSVAPLLMSRYNESKSRSLARSMSNSMPKRNKAPVSKTEIPFASLSTGLSDLVSHAYKLLLERGVRVLLGHEVTKISPQEGYTNVTIAGLDGESSTIDARGVAIATPAGATAALIREFSTSVADKIASIEYAPVAMLLQSYPKGSFGRRLDGSGVLIPRTNENLVTAITFASQKWQRLANQPSEILRVSVGRFNDRRALELTDEELSGRITKEVQEILNTNHQPTQTATYRWSQALPQYRPFHKDLVENIRKELFEFGNIELCGAALDGIGIPTCIKSGRTAARKLLRSESDNIESKP